MGDPETEKKPGKKEEENRQFEDAYKAVMSAQRRLEALSEQNKEYERFFAVNRISAVKELLDKEEMELDDFTDSGMMFIQHLMTIEFRVCFNTLDAIVLFLREEEKEKFRAKMSELMKGFEKVKASIDRYEELAKRVKREKTFEAFNRRPELPPAEKKDDLLEMLTGFIDKLPKNGDNAVEIPERLKERYVPFDFVALENELLRNTGSTVKGFGRGYKLAENQNLGVAVTFQACLLMEQEGRVTLSQGEGDVIIGPFVPAPETDDLGP